MASRVRFRVRRDGMLPRVVYAVDSDLEPRVRERVRWRSVSLRQWVPIQVTSGGGSEKREGL